MHDLNTNLYIAHLMLINYIRNGAHTHVQAQIEKDYPKICLAMHMYISSDIAINIYLTLRPICNFIEINTCMYKQLIRIKLPTHTLLLGAIKITPHKGNYV